MHDHDAVGQEPEEHGASDGEATPPARRRYGLLGVAGAAWACYAWWAVGLAPFSGWATLAVVAAGVAAMACGRRLPRRCRPAVELRRAAPWMAVAGVASAWQLAALVQHPRQDHPTLSSLTNAVLDSHPARAVAFAAWSVAAAGLARR